MDPTTPPAYAYLDLFHPRGPKLRLPIPLAGEPVAPIVWQTLILSVNAALDAGLVLDQPGLEEGERKDAVRWVVKRIHDNGNGTETPIVDLYPDNEQLKFAVLSHYLNEPAHVEAFEQASGLQLNQLPAYIGAGKLERGASRQTDAMIIAAPRPFNVCSKPNPRHDPNETDPKKKKPKRIFSRWPDLTPPLAVATAESKEEAAKAQQYDDHRQLILGRTFGAAPPPRHKVPEYPPNPPSVPNHQSATFEQRIMTDMADDLRDTADHILKTWLRPENAGEKPWRAHLLGKAFQQMMFLARNAEEVSKLVLTLNKTITMHPALLSAAWKEYLLYFAEERLKQLNTELARRQT